SSIRKVSEGVFVVDLIFDPARIDNVRHGRFFEHLILGITSHELYKQIEIGAVGSLVSPVEVYPRELYAESSPDSPVQVALTLRNRAKAKVILEIPEPLKLVGSENIHDDEIVYQISIPP